MAEKNDRVVSMHVEEGGYPTRLQGCFHNPLLQTEWKSISINLYQLQCHLSLINCWKDTDKITLNYIESPECAS